MHKLLVVDESDECQFIVKKALSNLQVQLTSAMTVRDAIREIDESKRSPFDLVLLDLSLPDGHGLSVLEHLQSDELTRDIPVFMMNGTEELTSKILAFDLGADDYLVKPVNLLELRARIENRLRKNKRKTSTALKDTLKKGNLLLETSLLKASLIEGENKRNLELTSKEFKLLCLLARNEGQTFSRNDLVKSVWGESVHILNRTVDSHICTLRRKLGSCSNYVESIPSVGYRFVT